jgi:hypothetical protein
MTITVATPAGKAIVHTHQQWNRLGPFEITGPGADIARDWLATAYGAFGHLIGNNAAPSDLHCAAMNLKQSPETDVTFVDIEDDPDLPYDNGLDQQPAGSVC